MSIEELKKTKKRTRLIYHEEDIFNWGKFPIVILAKALDKQDWFKGKIEFYIYGERLDYRKAEEELKKYPYSTSLPALYLTQQHKTFSIEVVLEWCIEETRCSIALSRPVPIYNNMAGQNSIASGKRTKSKYIEGVFKRIKEVFEAAIPEADKRIATILKEEKEKIKAKEFHKNLCKELGVELYRNNVNYEQYDYVYGKDRGFAVGFRKSKEKGTFSIFSIKGTFGIKEIKQFIKIVGGNPRAVVNRLTNKK